MFQICDVVLINKRTCCPTLILTWRNAEKTSACATERQGIPICAKTGEGVDEWADWLRAEVKAWRRLNRDRTEKGCRI